MEEWEDEECGGHMKCEFHRGDVIVQIGGSTTYVVIKPVGDSIWYSLLYLWCGKVVHTDVHRESIDSDYVKVDHCKDPHDFDDVFKKLSQIACKFDMDMGGKP